MDFDNSILKKKKIMLKILHVGMGFRSTLKYKYEVLVISPNSLTTSTTYLCLEAFAGQHFPEVAKPPDVRRLQALAPVRTGSSMTAAKMICSLIERHLVFWQVGPMVKGGD